MGVEGTRLKQQEQWGYNMLAGATHDGDAVAAADALAEIGLTHARMEPQKLPQAAQEIWAGMRGQNVKGKLATAAKVLHILTASYDPESAQYAAALRREQAAR